MTNLTQQQEAQVDSRISKAFKLFQDNGLAEALGRIKSLEDTVAILMRTIDQQNGIIENQRIIANELQTMGAAAEPSNVWAALESNPAVKSSFLGMVSVERNMAQQKEKNLVIFGVEEISEPRQVKEKVTDILDKIGMKRHARNAKTIRFRPEGPITVSFESTEVKMKVLKEARRLRDMVDYKKVYIHLDLTKSEMDRNKDLRKKQRELNTALTLGTGNHKYGMHKFSSEGVEEPFYWGTRRDQLTRIRRR